MTEAEYIAYFQNLATQHKAINHLPTDKAFFYIENTDQLDEFDEALRSCSKNTLMLMVANSGEFDDNNTENNTEENTIELYVLIRQQTDVGFREINQLSKVILLNVITRTKRDFKQKKPTFRISKIPFQKVGPMHEEWYGFMSVLSFVCPFGYTLNSSIWSDIID